MFLDPVASLRRFNRAVVREAGALDTSFLGRGRPLGAARVLHLISSEGTDVANIRATLGLDSGLMSRFLRALEREHLIETQPDPVDRRRSIARLTPAGQAEVAAYETLNNDRAARILAQAGSRAADVVAAMDLIATLLNRDHLKVRQTDPDSTAALFCLQSYFDELVARVPAARPEMFVLPDPGANSYRPPHGSFLVAWSDDLPVGCVSLRPLDALTAEIKRLWVHSSARGQGLARRLMSAIEDEARTMGHRYLKLDTNSALTEAITLYRNSGWVDIDPYTGPPGDTWMGKVL